jgi:DNA-binding transcriptional MerR regulator
MAAELTIGDFSRITHLSIKTLRYYHRVGLLEPAEIDAGTGYRYYTPAQVPAAQTIRRFRDLDMPVEQVRAVLDAPDAATRDGLIATHLDRMQRQLTQTQSAIESLRSLLRHPSLSIDIERRTVPAVAALAISTTVARSELVEWWAGAMAELQQTLAGLGVPAAGAPGGIFADGLFTEDHGDAVVFVPVDLGNEPMSAAWDDRGRVQSFTVPAVELAITQVDGPHDDIDRVYAALGRYATDLGIDARGPVREYYLVGGPDVAEWRTEIGWPIRATGRS